MKQLQKGFTLIELMIVVAIIAFWPQSQFRPIRTTSRVRKCPKR